MEQRDSDIRQPYEKRWWLLIATSMGLFMIVLDSTVVNVSIPSIIRDLNAPLATVEWVLNAYTIVFASLMITFGRLGDMFGRRLMFLIGTVTFGVGSLACGLAPSGGFLIAARSFQAIGSAFMLPATLSLVTAYFPARERGRALGIWGSVTGVGLGLGPVVGGFLTQYNWRYVFLVNLPVVAATIPFTLWAVPHRQRLGQHRIDYPGIGLSVSMLAAFSYAMISGPALGWTRPLIAGLLGVSAVLFAAFLLWEKRAAEPLIDVRLFRDRTFTAGNAAATLLIFSLFGIFFLMPLFLQNALHFSALATGLALTPMSFAMMAMAPVSGWLSDRAGPRWLSFAGMAVAAVALFAMSSLSIHTTARSLAPWFLLTGLGLGLVLAPVTSAVMGTAPRGEEGSVSGVLATTRQVGGVLGVAILGAVLQSVAARQLPASVGSVIALQAQAAPVVVDAFMSALNAALRVAAGVTALGAVASLFLPTTPSGRIGEVA